MRRFELPYFDERQAKIDMIVVHCVAYDVQGAINSFHRNQVSAHYLIDEKGHIYRLIDEDKCAWHAGVSSWRGKQHINQHSIGIELCSQSFGQDVYPFKQITALVRLCRRLKQKYHIKRECIVGHSDIAPVRKADPGKAFPWRYLAKNGLGVWYDLKNADKISVSDKAELLSMIGYDVSNIKAAQTAFVRHFMGNCLQNDSVQNLLEKPFETALKNLSDEKFLCTLKAVAYNFGKR